MALVFSSCRRTWLFAESYVQKLLYQQRRNISSRACSYPCPQSTRAVACSQYCHNLYVAQKCLSSTARFINISVDSSLDSGQPTIPVLLQPAHCDSTDPFQSTVDDYGARRSSRRIAHCPTHFAACWVNSPRKTGRDTPHGDKISRGFCPDSRTILQKRLTIPTPFNFGVVVFVANVQTK